ncbi:hypothetical protein PVL29_026040 [Vitis rotundifolia]|uniref:Uncharacterized protein n=1 Tax=Vitis rotundifolia TaxID=103349 RepID=A0AA38YLI4_VITRO|nr:hypothetical protein PVL29_026040 [Vitis rotundifolia]
MRIQVVEEGAIQSRGIAISDLSRVVRDDGLGGEVGCILGSVILRIGGNKPTLEIIHSNVFHVETEIVTRQSLWERLMVHLNKLDFSCQSRGPKVTTMPGYKAPFYGLGVVRYHLELQEQTIVQPLLPSIQTC